MNNTIIILIAIIATINIVINLLLLKRSEFKGTQLFLQSLIIWLLPIIGAAIIWTFIKEMDNKSEPSKPPFGGGDNGGF